MQRQAVWSVGLALLLAAGEAFAQASPFATGATAFQGSFLAILTPIAVIAVMALGLAAWFRRRLEPAGLPRANSRLERVLARLQRQRAERRVVECVIRG